MMPPADGILEQNEQESCTPDKMGHTGSDDFLAIGLVVRILQLNVDGLSAAKRFIIWHIAERQRRRRLASRNSCCRLSISVFDLISYTLHAKHGRALYTRNDLIVVSAQLSTSHSDVVKIGGYNIANVYKPPTEPWENTPIHSLLCHIQLYHPLYRIICGRLQQSPSRPGA